MYQVKLIIPTPDDSNTFNEIEYGIATDSLFSISTSGHTTTVNFDRSKSDPLLGGLAHYFGEYFFNRKNANFRSRYSRKVKSIADGVYLNLYGCPILITHTSRVAINGVKHSVSNAISILSRLFIKAIREKDGAKLMMYLAYLNDMPENVSYALENRAPYNFWNDYQKHEVRLNVELIGDNEVGIEVSDGVWGTMTIKELDSFCNAHRNGSNRSKWAYMSPRQLYTQTVGKEPLDSEIKVMKSFLLQNRTSEMVENRARELVHSMVEKYPYRIGIEEDENGFVTTMFVRGKLYDWKLQAKRTSASTTQDVSTYVYSTNVDGEPTYRGPICIDNLGSNSSIGDQYVARALALLNDNIVVEMVSTIKSYLPETEIRDENNGLH